MMSIQDMLLLNTMPTLMSTVIKRQPQMLTSNVRLQPLRQP